jgi:hypothetical protein
MTSHDCQFNQEIQNHQLECQLAVGLSITVIVLFVTCSVDSTTTIFHQSFLSANSAVQLSALTISQSALYLSLE